MANNANFQIPFSPQAEVAGQIMTGIKNAHDIFAQMQAQKIAQGQLGVALQNAARRRLNKVSGRSTQQMSRISVPRWRSGSHNLICFDTGTETEARQWSFDARRAALCTPR
jgi:hypothetical protein